MTGSIRRARLEERPRITEIRFAVRENQLSDPSRVTDADYHWFSENPGIWVWEEDGRILGFSAADTRDGTIWALFIDPGHEGHGIGRALLAKACDVLRQAGVSYSVIPGITAVQALAARHKIPLNRIAEPVALTTGRKLAEGFPPGIDSVAVLLDGEDTYRRFADAKVHGDMEIYWGAYLGTPDEILIAGKLADVADEIHRRRAEARRANGWIMDTYVMRRPAT